MSKKLIEIGRLKLNNPICFIGQFYSDEARIIGDKPPASNEWPIIGNGSQKGRGYRYYWVMSVRLWNFNDDGS